MRKYRNVKTTLDGISFDSRKEANRYAELRILEKAGLIQNLQMQVKYVLIPEQREPDTLGARGGVHKGRLIEKECAYIADFVYEEDGKSVVEDTKVFRTKDYIIKRMLMLKVHGIRIKEI